MKVCNHCGDQISTRDGENLCRRCDDLAMDGKRVKRNKARRERDALIRSFGLTLVRGALGGTYWE